MSERVSPGEYHVQFHPIWCLGAGEFGVHDDVKMLFADERVSLDTCVSEHYEPPPAGFVVRKAMDEGLFGLTSAEQKRLSSLVAAAFLLAIATYSGVTGSTDKT